MMLDLDRVEINEVADAMVGDAPEFCPFAQRANGGLLAFWEDPAHAKAFGIHESRVEGGIWGRVHARPQVSTGRSGRMATALLLRHMIASVLRRK